MYIINTVTLANVCVPSEQASEGRCPPGGLVDDSIETWKGSFLPLVDKTGHKAVSRKPEIGGDVVGGLKTINHWRGCVSQVLANVHAPRRNVGANADEDITKSACAVATESRRRSPGDVAVVSYLRQTVLAVRVVKIVLVVGWCKF